MPFRILTVCLGNICRSPTTEAAIREAAERVDIDVEVDSAGTGAWHVGNPPDRRMTSAALDDGLMLRGAARQVTADDFAAFDLILAMDRANLRDLMALAPDDEGRAKVRLFRDFAGEPDQDVPDPYYGGSEGFREVVAIARAGAAGVVDAIRAGAV